MAERFASVASVVDGLRTQAYLADEGTGGVVFLADRLEKPILVEGPAGVGKTELAKALASLTGSRLIRLQCYEGLDEAKALYEWNYKKQLLRIQADREHESSWEQTEADIFSEPFLLTRPLLEAVRATEPVVLLIDEVDRVEIETEALLLEVLSETIDWARTLVHLGVERVDTAVVGATLHVLLKYQRDIEKARKELKVAEV
jgi:MoxR-like ATPase